MVTSEPQRRKRAPKRQQTTQKKDKEVSRGINLHDTSGLGIQVQRASQLGQVECHLQLAALAVEKGGFLTNTVRCVAWPALCGIGYNVPMEYLRTERPEKHNEYAQMIRDVDRSLWAYCKDDEKLLQSKRKSLLRIMNAILLDHPELNYYQGFHDVCSVCLMVCGEERGGSVAEYIAMHHLKHNMRCAFDVTELTLQLIFPLLSRVDPELHRHIMEAELYPQFAISWHITWLAHNIESLEQAARLFDFLIGSPPLVIVYVAVEILVHMRSLALTPTFPLTIAHHIRDRILGVEAEFSEIYSVVQKVPQDLPFDEIIQRAANLLKQYPLAHLVRHAGVKFDRSLNVLWEPPLWQPSYMGFEVLLRLPKLSAGYLVGMGRGEMASWFGILLILMALYTTLWQWFEDEVWYYFYGAYPHGRILH